jgi:uncharacterized coiled-coil DUF342 family protein
MSRVYISLVVLLVTLSGCKNESESAMSSIVDKFKEMASVLKDVKDKDSAVAAKPKLEALSKEMNEVMTKMTSKKLNDEEFKKASEKYRPEAEEAMKTLEAEGKRIAQIPGAAEALGSSAFGFGMGMGGMWK